MMGRLNRWAAALALVAGLSSPVAAESLVVVELYTSQGCSSCPPADELLRELSRRDGVLPLALHVDYWDYIGWKDTFASPQHTARQRAYAHVAGARTVYTPQMVIGGRDHLVGTKAMELGELVMKHAGLPPKVRLSVARQGGRVEISGEPLVRIGGPVVVQLVRFIPEAVVDVRRGENAGRRLAYTNIVTEWHDIGRWNGVGRLSLEAEVNGQDRTAVILQEEGPGAILAAAVVR